MTFTAAFLDELRARLPVSEVVGGRVQLTKSGREWKGLSPFQQERTPSFFVNDQKQFWHCFSSGKTGDVFGFLMEIDGIDFPEAVKRCARIAGIPVPANGGTEKANSDRRPKESKPAAAPKPYSDARLLADDYRLTATYSYCEQNGALVHEVLRYEKFDGFGLRVDKTFRQRRPDGRGGSFADSGPRRVIYRLPLLAKAGHNRIFVTEGEKDADRLGTLGFLATTTASGNWSGDIAKALAGYECLILEDNDEAGRGKALKAAAALYPVAESVRIVRLPGLADGQDVSDWLDAGSNQNALLEISVASPVWKPDIAMNEISERAGEGVTLADFYAYMPMHSYIFAPSREMWPASSVKARIPPVTIQAPDGPKLIPASQWLDSNKPVEQMTWAPGMPMLIRDRLIADGGWIERNKVTCFNLYRPPTLKPGNASQVSRWVDHVHKVYPADADYIIRWLAHRVQRPHEKINHALVLGGNQGVGKDTLLEPVKYAIGPWNFTEVSPQHLLASFNGFLKSVILRVSEARDLGEVDRFKLYDHTKSYIASPPDVLRVNEKHLREHAVVNVTGVIFTSNHKSDGIYLPADDRRHFVAWSELSRDDFTADYWNTLWRWYGNGGTENVAAYLASLDLSAFDPKAPPPKTDAFWAIVDASRAPEDAELADVLDSLGNPNAVTLSRIEGMATGDFQVWLRDRRNRRVIPHRLERSDYIPVRNDAARDGLWKAGGKRQVIYAKSELSIRDRTSAVNDLVARSV